MQRGVGVPAEEEEGVVEVCVCAEDVRGGAERADVGEEGGREGAEGVVAGECSEGEEEGGGVDAG